MQIYLYFCGVKKFIRTLCIILFLSPSLEGKAGERFSASLDDIILDIYNAAAELSEVDYEQLQSDLYALYETPVDLNNTSDEELARLYFLSPKQIDDILAYADRHPFESLAELRLIPSLADYEIRDLLPFVHITNHHSPMTNSFPKEVFANARHELIARVDARNIEGVETADPMYVQTRYRFDYRRRVVFGAQLRRPAGGGAKDLQYGAYVQLRDIAPHLHTVVGGNFQASFGQGLVLAPVFRSGKSAYVASVGQSAEGLRYYSSVDGEGLHGAGTTLRWEWDKQTRLDVSALYSMKRANDSVWHHLVGANLTFRYKRLQVQLTAIENIWSDSIRPTRNAAYNQHYFRGTNQAVLGASARYNHGWFDAFAELATAQNYTISSLGSSAVSLSEAAHSVIPQWRLSFRFRAKQKGATSTYSARFQFNWQRDALSLRTTAEANIIPSKLSTLNSHLTYGFTVYQDISYTLPFRGGPGRGLSFHLRLQAFDAREWGNRIYCYEHDVLYAFSIPAVYGLGGRAYLCLKWQIIKQLALYFRVSETLYARNWYIEKHPESPITNHKSQIPSRTDLHLLLRATL